MPTNVDSEAKRKPIININSIEYMFGKKNMNNNQIIERLPTQEEFISLRHAAGWSIPENVAVTAALEKTLYAVCVEENGKCVGSGRVIGDGALVFYVQDVIVLPECQRNGYGTKMMDAIMNYIQMNASPTAFIALFSAKGMESWYSRYGFIERSIGNLGPGMAFLKKK
ncbi:MAG: GNAT family N-acetyltransferase [Victivallales bacterium]|nr:GNAT family N-acetyltransferase [Victivallales bacterium]